jgi:phosphoribosyl 1,2-cyclic phosphodiesterase
MMMAPLFPVPMGILNAQVTFRDYHSGETIQPRPGVTIKTARLNHPNGATGYRVEFGGRVIAYITDTEHTAGKLDQNVLGLVDRADIMIYDSSYTDAEYPRYKGWGHSTWQEGIRLCREADAKRMVVFHHDPDHDDEMLDGIAREVEKLLPGSVVAREGLVLEP